MSEYSLPVLQRFEAQLYVLNKKYQITQTKLARNLIWIALKDILLHGKHIRKISKLYSFSSLISPPT